MTPELQAHYLPEPTGPELDAFRISGTTAIRQLIQGLVSGHALITLYARRDHMFFVATQVLEFDDGTIDFDLNTDAHRRNEILAGDDCIVVAFLDQIKIQFDVRILEARAAAGRWRLRCRAPETVYRLQRRDAFRVRPGPVLGATCVLRNAGRPETRRTIVDLSVTGVSLAWPQDEPPPPVDTVWEHSRIEVERRVPLPCTLVVRTVEHAEPGSVARIGCAFTRLPPEIERALQCLVTDIERAMRRPG